jgi:hypothetical protein
MPSGKKWSDATIEQADEIVDDDQFLIIQASTGDSKRVTQEIISDAIIPYRKYVALLTQTSTNAPVVTALEDTLGVTPVWNRQSAGEYRFTLTGAFPAGKVVVLVGPLVAAPVDVAYGIYANRVNDNYVTVITYALAAASTGVDGRLSATPIEIRIYP